MIDPSHHRDCDAIGSRVTVEVVMCTYRGARYVTEQLASILSQSRPIDLLSIYDDCSADDTVAVIERFLAADGRGDTDVRVHVNATNLGYAQNFGEALARATGDLVLFSDQDDVWATTKVERLVAALGADTCDLVFSDGIVIDAHGAPTDDPTVLAGYGLSASAAADFAAHQWPSLLRRNYVNGAALAARRTLAQAALPIPDGFPHDYWLALWFARRHRIACLYEPLYRYRIHADNAIGGARRSPRRHQLAAILRNPSGPRRQEARRMRALLARMSVHEPGRDDVERKLDWLRRVHEEPRRERRLLNVLTAWARGEYRRFAAPHALMRDLVGVCH